MTDQKNQNQPLEDAVVTFTPRGGAPAVAAVQGEMVQAGRQFTPFVLIVPVGSRVRFPNRDEVRHHVYSTSAPKNLDLPLYIGEPAEPQLFDKPGVVSLGCNIHDWMAAYIYVTATPFYGLTSTSGQATLRGLPAGGGVVEVWHPRLGERVRPLSIELPAGSVSLPPVALRLRRDDWRRRQAPAAGDAPGGYR
jgi:plastocyanin